MKGNEEKSLARAFLKRLLLVSFIVRRKPWGRGGERWPLETTRRNPSAWNVETVFARLQVCELLGSLSSKRRSHRPWTHRAQPDAHRPRIAPSWMRAAHASRPAGCAPPTLPSPLNPQLEFPLVRNDTCTGGLYSSTGVSCHHLDPPMHGLRQLHAS